MANTPTKQGKIGRFEFWGAEEDIFNSHLIISHSAILTLGHAEVPGSIFDIPMKVVGSVSSFHYSLH